MAEAGRYRETTGLGRLLERVHLDGWLLVGLLALGALSMVVLYSVGDGSTGLVTRQAIRFGVGLMVMFFVAQFPPQVMRMWTPAAFLAGTALLLAVVYTGDVGKGAQRWLDLGFMRFQPSEIMKLAVPMMVAWYLHDRPLPPSLWRSLIPLSLVAIPVYLIAIQPDLGTSLMIGVSGLLVVFMAGLRWRVIIGLGALAAAMTPVLWRFMHDYQRRRVLTFLDPERDPLGDGYHIIQSKIAIGSGGMFGKGWLNGSQAHLEFLPERSTDFIFAVMGEEFGLLGLTTTLVIYLFLVGRGLMIAVQAQDTFSRLVAGALSLTFFLYVFVNTGMVTGLLPVVGVPLPLISYGGTAMVTLLASFGILMSIQTHRRLMAS